MVTDKIRIRDKWRWLKRTLVVFGVVFVIGIILGAMFLFGFFTGKREIVLENPVAGIVFANTNVAGEVNIDKVIEQAIVEFDGGYINYILTALGVGYLHKSPIPPFENPFIEFDLGGEIWNSEIVRGEPNSAFWEIDNEDLRIILSKEEAVRSLLSQDIEQFMKDSVVNGNTKLEMVSGKIELFSKGYLEMYKEITGEEISAE